MSEETPHLDPTAAKTSALLVCWCPISIFQGDVEIWKNPVPNSTEYARPVALIRTKEERVVLDAEVPGWTPFLRDYQGEAVMDGHAVNVLHNTNWSMIDGKMVGLTTYNTCLEKWKCIERGEIAYSNTAGRQGQCHQPINKTPLIFFSLLHFQLRSLDFCLKILYHLVAGVKDWSESTQVTRFISNGKGECLNHIEAKTGLVYNKPTDKGGNTNCGPIAIKFFSPTLRPEICVLIKNSEDRENLIHLLKLMNAH